MNSDNAGRGLRFRAARLPYTWFMPPWHRLPPATLCVLLAVVYAAIVGVTRASRTIFWFDEVATVLVADEGWTGIWTALKSGADANPPTFYLAEAFGNQLTANPQLGYRLAPLAGFLGIPPALFLFVRRRRDGLAGVVAALLPFLTPLFVIYSIQARPYSLVTCCVAWSLVAWQRADRRWPVILLAALLASASSFHYYAVFALVPFGLAEFARTLRLAEVRVGVWIALAVGAAPLAIFWPLLSGFQQEYGAAFWAQRKLITAYAELIGLSDRWTAPLVITLTAALVASVVMRRANEIGSVSPSNPVPLEETVLVLGLIGLPVIVTAAALVLNGPMVARYVVPSVLGIAAALAFAISEGGRRATRWLLAAMLAILAGQHSDYWRFGEFSNAIPRHADLPLLRQLVTRHQTDSSPIVVSNALSYLPVAYYAANAQDAPVYVADLASAREVVGSDSTERALLMLAPFGPLRIRPLSEFIATQSSFLVFAEGGQNGAWDWLPARLAQQGHAVRLIEDDRSAGWSHFLYRVDVRRAATRTPE